MPTPARDFGVQSYCFRETKSNEDLAKKVRQIGIEKLEICGVHADFAKPEAFGEIVKIHSDAGVKIVSLGVQTFTGNVAVERKWFECAKIAGAKYISAHFTIGTYLDAIPAAVKLGEEFGVKIAIHCHGGYMFGGSADVLEHLLKLGGPQIGLNIDTAWCMQLGPHHGKPVEWAKKFAGRVYGVHYKDFIFDKNAKWNDVVVGTGNLDLPAFVTALEDGGFDGFAVIEYEADPENPVPALTECVRKMRKSGEALANGGTAMSELDPDSVRPVLPLEYAMTDEFGPIVRPIGWLTLAASGVLLIDMPAQYLMRYAFISGIAFVGRASVVTLLFGRLAVLMWIAIAARRLSTGNLSAVRPLRIACLLLAGLICLTAIVGLTASAVNGRTLAGMSGVHVFYGTLRTAAEAVVPLTLWAVLRRMPNAAR